MNKLIEHICRQWWIEVGVNLKNPRSRESMLALERVLRNENFDDIVVDYVIETLTSENAQISVEKLADEFYKSGNIPDEFYKLSREQQREFTKQTELLRTKNKAITSSENKKFEKQLKNSAKVMSDNLPLANTFYSTNTMSSKYKDKSERESINDARIKFSEAEREYKSTTREMHERLSGIRDVTKFYSDEVQTELKNATSIAKQKEFGGWVTTNELNIGKTLFGKSVSGPTKLNPLKKVKSTDSPFGSEWDWEDAWGDKSFIKKLKAEMGKYANEPNTKEEYDLLKFLESWLVAPSIALKKLPSDIFSNFKFLLGVKNKYPLILDPLKSQHASSTNFVYRAVKIPTDLAVKIIKNGNLKNVRKTKGSELLQLVESTASIKSGAMQRKKAASFSLDFKSASGFFDDYVDNETLIGMGGEVSCILQVPIDSPNLLFNPDFFNLLTTYREQETFYIGDSDIAVSGIWFPIEFMTFRGLIGEISEANDQKSNNGEEAPKEEPKDDEDDEKQSAEDDIKTASLTAYEKEKLDEFNIGKTLFGKAISGKGVGDGNPPQWDWMQTWYFRGNTKFIKKLKAEMGKYANEPNTKEEYDFLNFIQKWVHHGFGEETQKAIPHNLFKNFHFLLKIKNKFPLILNPTYGDNVGKYVYRATTISKSVAREILGDTQTSKDDFSIDANTNFGNQRFTRIKKSMSIPSGALRDKNAASFTAKLDVAMTFLKRYSLNPELESEKTQCIIEVPTNSPNLLFNPDFLNIFSHFNEAESLYIDKSSIDISAIFLDERRI